MPTLALPTTDLTVDLGALVVGWGAGLGTTGWQAFSVDVDGTLVAELDVVTWGDLSEQIGQPMQTTIGLASTDTAGLAACVPWESEVQIYRDGELIGWFVPLPYQWSSSSPIVEIGLVDVSVWLSKRACIADDMGAELLTNGSFEDDFARWQTYGTPSISVTHVDDGTYAALLSASTDRVVQRVVVDRASTIAVSARVWIDSGTWTAAATTSGLEVYATPWTGYNGKDTLSAHRVTASTTQDGWVTLAASVTLTEGRWDLWVRVWGVDGDMWVDNVQARPYRTARRTVAAGIFPPESTPQIDTGQLVRDLAIPALSDLHIGVVSPDTAWLIDDEPGAWDDKYLSEMLDVLRRIDAPSDWTMECTPTTRTLRMWYQADTRDNGVALTLTAANTLSASGTMESASRRTRVIVLGEGGFSVVVDSPGDDPGGHHVDEIVQAPSGTPLSELDAVGRAHMRASQDRTVQVTVKAPWSTAGDLRLCDVILLDADTAGQAGAGSFRIVARSIDPKASTVELTLNPYSGA